MMKQSPTDSVKKVVKQKDFNDYSIKCVGKHVTIKVNGETTVDDDFPKMPDEGIIAWQLHAGGGDGSDLQGHPVQGSEQEVTCGERSCVTPRACASLGRRRNPRSPKCGSNPSGSFVELLALAAELSIDVQGVGGTAFPGVRFGRLHGAAPDLVPPILILHDALHGLTPTVDVQRVDERRLASDGFGDGAGRGGEDGAAAGHHLHRR